MAAWDIFHGNDQPGSGLIVAPDTFSETHGELIISLTGRHRVPAVYAISRIANKGGLVSYGPDVRRRVRRFNKITMA